MIEEVADTVYPTFHYLESLAAQERLLHANDTTVRILSCMLENMKPRTNLKRKGMFTTGILSYIAKHKIYLYYIILLTDLPLRLFLLRIPESEDR